MISLQKLFSGIFIVLLIGVMISCSGGKEGEESKSEDTAGSGNIGQFHEFVKADLSCNDNKWGFRVDNYDGREGKEGFKIDPVKWTGRDFYFEDPDPMSSLTTMACEGTISEDGKMVERCKMTYIFEENNDEYIVEFKNLPLHTLSDRGATFYTMVSKFDRNNFTACKHDMKQREEGIEDALASLKKEMNDLTFIQLDLFKLRK